MKQLNFILLLALFCVNRPLTAQLITTAEAEAYANQLVKKEILTSAGKQTLLSLIAKKEIEIEHPSTVKQISYTSSDLSKETILEFCANAFAAAQAIRITKRTKPEQDVIQEDPVGPRTFHFFGFPGGRLKDDFLSSKRSTLGFTRTRTLKDFNETGLITDLVYKDCLEHLRDSSIIDEVALLRYMTDRSIYYRYYEFNKKEQIEYIAGLKNMELLTAKAEEELVNSYNGYQLKSIPEILQYSARYILIDLTNYEAKPNIIYPAIFEQIKKLLPDFKYADLKPEIQEQKEFDLIRQDINLSFLADGNIYRQVFFHDYKNEPGDKKHKEIPPSKLDQDFHKIINKWLTDKESIYRVYAVNILGETENYLSRSKTGLLLLKEGEAEKISTDVNRLSRESFDNRLSRKNIEKIITEFTTQNFFSHLSKEQIDSAKKEIASADINSLEDILLRFPKTIIVFDWETGNLENPYEELTNYFAEASRGAVTISNIVDEYKKAGRKTKSVKYGFVMNGKKYETLLPFENDWLSPNFMKLFEKALIENKIDGKLYYCVDNGQETGFIFLNTRQLEFVRKLYPDLLKDKTF